MIGFGQVHYESSSGRHSDWFKIGFSPRKYLTSLKHIDIDILTELIEDAWLAPQTDKIHQPVRETIGE